MLRCSSTDFLWLSLFVLRSLRRARSIRLSEFSPGYEAIYSLYRVRMRWCRRGRTAPVFQVRFLLSMPRGVLLCTILPPRYPRRRSPSYRYCRLRSKGGLRMRAHLECQ